MEGRGGQSQEAQPRIRAALGPGRAPSQTGGPGALHPQQPPSLPHRERAQPRRRGSHGRPRRADAAPRPQGRVPLPAPRRPAQRLQGNHRIRSGRGHILVRSRTRPLPGRQGIGGGGFSQGRVRLSHGGHWEGCKRYGGQSVDAGGRHWQAQRIQRRRHPLHEYYRGGAWPDGRGRPARLCIRGELQPSRRVHGGAPRQVRGGGGACSSRLRAGAREAPKLPEASGCREGIERRGEERGNPPVEDTANGLEPPQLPALRIPTLLAREEDLHSPGVPALRQCAHRRHRRQGDAVAAVRDCGRCALPPRP
mmetsp:Transcript_71471/g.225732  ORF Transcript_71471/g.225732 Transcript_71471/m.225732 type:complete len:308 (-) Transcript_71471:953-1876(-)